MNFPDIDWAATYEVACIAAIEAFVAQEDKRRPRALRHHGISLTSALERQLYIAAMQEPSLQYLYACSVAGVKPVPQTVPEELQGMACHLVPRTGVRRILSPGSIARRLILWLPPVARWLRRSRYGASREPSQARPVLVAVHHPKFVQYLRPITDAMPGQFIFLITTRDRRKQDFPLGEREWASLPHAAPWPTPGARAWPALAVWTEELSAALDRHNPRCVLCVEGDAPYHELLARLARQRGIPALCLQWGAFPYRSPRIGFRRMGHDAFLSWGDGFNEQLLPFNPDLLFISVGNHMIDPRPSISARRVVFLMQGVDHVNISEQSWQAFLSFTAWVSARYPDWEIVIRSHPSVPLTAGETDFLGAPNVRFDDPVTVALRNSLSGAALAVTMISSAILEAVAQGVVPFLFNPTGSVPRFKPDFETWQAGIETKTLTDAKREIAVLLDENDADGPALSRFRPGLDKLRRHFFAAVGPAALDSILSVLRQTIAHKFLPHRNQS